MNKDIQFLRDFLSCDRWRIAELRDILYAEMQQIGQMLRRNQPFFSIVFDDEGDPLWELAQLLDGNNFKVEYSTRGNVFQIATITPIYLETIEVEYESAREPDLLQTFETIVAEIEAEADTEYEEKITNSSKHYDSIFDLYNNAAAASNMMYDEVLKPP